MIIDVRIIPEGRSEIEQKAALEAFKGDLPPFAEPVACRAAVDRRGATVVADVRFSGVFEIECARCLEIYGERVDGALRVVIKEEAGKHGAAPDGGDAGVDFYFDAGREQVDIGAAIYDEIMISLPLKPLCSEGCEGIKADGADGGEKPADPRWAGLLKLKNR